MPERNIPVSTKEAERFGLVNWVVDDAALETRTSEIADRLADSATMAITQMKQLLRQSWDNTLEQQLFAEAQTQLQGSVILGASNSRRAQSDQGWRPDPPAVAQTY